MANSAAYYIYLVSALLLPWFYHCDQVRLPGMLLLPRTRSIGLSKDRSHLSTTYTRAHNTHNLLPTAHRLRSRKHIRYKSGLLRFLSQLLPFTIDPGSSILGQFEFTPPSDATTGLYSERNRRQFWPRGAGVKIISEKSQGRMRR